MKNCKFSLILFCVLSLLILPSCRNEDISTEHPNYSTTTALPENSDNTPTYELTSEISLGATTYDVAPENTLIINRMLTDNVYIDTEVLLPSSEIASYIICRNVYSPEFLSDVFNQDSSLSVTSSADDPVGFTASTSDGALFYQEYYTLKYTYSRQDNEIADVLRNYTKNTASYNNADFSEFSRERALAVAESVFDTLNVLGIPKTECFIGLSHDEISDYQMELMQNEGYAYFVDIGKTLRLDNLSHTDDAYYFWFTFNLNGISIIDTNTTPYLNVSFFDIFPPTVCAELVVTREGVKYFYMYGSFREKGVSEMSPMLPFDSILDEATKKYELQIVTNTMLFIGAQLEYLYVPNISGIDNDLILTPYWRLDFRTDIGGRGENIIYADRFNAFTGEDYAYGG